jgi:hypothetical protein
MVFRARRWLSGLAFGFRGLSILAVGSQLVARCFRLVARNPPLTVLIFAARGASAMASR